MINVDSIMLCNLSLYYLCENIRKEENPWVDSCSDARHSVLVARGPQPVNQDQVGRNLNQVVRWSTAFVTLKAMYTASQVACALEIFGPSREYSLCHLVLIDTSYKLIQHIYNFNFPFHLRALFFWSSSRSAAFTPDFKQAFLALTTRLSELAP